MLFGLLAKIRCRNCKKKKGFFLDFNAITLYLESRENVHAIYWLCSAKARKSYFYFFLLDSGSPLSVTQTGLSPLCQPPKCWVTGVHPNTQQVWFYWASRVTLITIIYTKHFKIYNLIMMPILPGSPPTTVRNR